MFCCCCCCYKEKPPLLSSSEQAPMKFISRTSVSALSSSKKHRSLVRKSEHSSTGVQTKLSSIQVRNEHRSTLYATPPFQLFRKWTWPMLVLTWRAAKFDTTSYSITGGVLTVFTQVISTEYETSAGAFSKLECSKRGAWDELIDRPALQYSEREVAVCSELIAGLFFSPCITYGN